MLKSWVAHVVLLAACCGCTYESSSVGSDSGTPTVGPASATATPASGGAAQASPTSSNAAAPAPNLIANEHPVTYKVRQVVRLDQIQPGAKLVRMWVSIPNDDPYQRLLDFNVVATPGKWSVVRDLDNRAQFLRVDVENPDKPEFDVEVDFVVTRQPVFVPVQTAKAGALTPGLKQAFAEYLAFNSPHMEVTDQIRKIADDVCGKETNLATQALQLMEHVERIADHYSYTKDPNMPKCGIGDAAVCLAQQGGCCTDLHSLFIALARARGIPARLAMGYRLREQNLGKMTDPGYRCWVEYFIPNYGWISSDIVEADTPNGLGHARWSTGLTARRVWLNPGRDYRFADSAMKTPINHMSIAHAEIDGVAARILPEGTLQPQITRKVLFTELQ